MVGRVSPIQAAKTPVSLPRYDLVSPRCALLGAGPESSTRTVLDSGFARDARPGMTEEIWTGGNASRRVERLRTARTGRAAGRGGRARRIFGRRVRHRR